MRSNGLLSVVGPVGQTAHLSLQSNFILRFTHISVDAQGSDLFCGAGERERHFIAGLGDSNQEFSEEVNIAGTVSSYSCCSF